MGGVGFKSRHKQKDPEPLRLDPKHTSNQKYKLATNPTESTLILTKKSKRPQIPRSGGKSVSSKRKQREREAAQKTQEASETKHKNSKNIIKHHSGASDSASNNENDDDDRSSGVDEDEGLEEARQAFFSAQDLVEPEEEDDDLLDDVEQEVESDDGDGDDSEEEEEEEDSSELKSEVKSSDAAIGAAETDPKELEEPLSKSHSSGSEDGRAQDDNNHSEDGSHPDAEGPSNEEDEEDDILEADVMNYAKGIPDLRKLYSRIQESVRVLGNWSVLGKRAKGRSRTDLAEQTLKDICEYFGYNEFLSNLLWELFGPEEALAFFEANETARPVTIRTNTLRTNRRELSQCLINRGVNLEPIGKWSKVGLQIFESSVPVGATPEYLAGQYMLQAASSFLPVIALDPQPGEKCLDMSAAPGGKTTFMAAMMKNTGTLFANDASKVRCKSLMANVTRMGCHNVIISNHDARDFPKLMGGFDRVLLDAPCSGTGVISKDPTAKTNKSEKDLLQLSHVQKQLILCAIDSVSPHSSKGGYVVYSTCSVTIEENESVVDYALKKRPNVKLVETGIGFGKEGFVNFRGKSFHSSLKLTRRFYPHVHNVDGFYVAKMKVNPKPKSSTANPPKEATCKDEHATGEEELATLEENEAVGFDDSEDAELIAAAKRAQLKAKGIHVQRSKTDDFERSSKKHKRVEQQDDDDDDEKEQTDGMNHQPVKVLKKSPSTTLSRHPKKLKKNNYSSLLT